MLEGTYKQPRYLMVTIMPKNNNKNIVFVETCPARRIMELFSVKWKSMVLHALYHWPEGKCRTGELQRALPGISKKMLIQTLRDVEESGLVHRHVYTVVPPKVEYSLTPLGKKFCEPVEMLFSWGDKNSDALDKIEKNKKVRNAKKITC